MIGETNTTDPPAPKSGRGFAAAVKAASGGSNKLLPQPKPKPAAQPQGQQPLNRQKSNQSQNKPTDFYSMVHQAANAANKPLSKREKVKDTINKLKGKVDLEEETSQWAIIYKRLGVHHWGLLLIVIIYAFIGAAIFEAIEGPEEARQKVQDRDGALKDAEFLSSNITQILAHSADASVPKAECAQNLSMAKEKIYDLIRKYQAEKNIGPSGRTNWDLWGSMFYAGTLFTTIGYGHYVPQTDLGRVMTMLYAFIGIPLVLAALNDLGGLLTRAIKTPWNVIRGGIHRAWHRYKKKRRRRNIAVSGNNLTSETPLQKDNGLTVPSSQSFDKVSEMGYQGTESVDSEELQEFDFPVPVALLMFLLWIVICAPIFCVWEDWTYFQSFYFFFISLTTIGLGDVVPDHPRYMIMLFPLVLMGLSLISMCVNLITQRMGQLKEDAIDFFEDQLGWDTESSDEGSEDEFGNVRQKPEKPPQPDKSRPESRSSGDWGGATLGIFSASNTNVRQMDKITDSARQAAAKWKTRRLAPPSRAMTPVPGAPVGPQKRKRRGVQTTESYVRTWKRDLRRRFPGVPFENIQNITPRSTDDVSSLLDETDVALSVRPAV